MPQPVPTIYTGKVATPNWSGFWSDFQTRQARNKQQRQQQAQFDALQNERILKDFLGSIDVDPINTANEGVQNRMNELSQGVEDIVTELLIKSGGKPSPQDRLEVQQLVNRTNQEVGVMKASLANRNADMKAFQKNAAWYDHDMIQENVYNWDGKSKYKSKLEDALIKLSPDEVGTAIRKTIKNANIFTETMERAGIKITIGAKADPSLVKRNAETREYENIDDTQVAYMKHAIMGFDGGFRYNRAIDEYWATLDDDTKQSYENQAANADLEREDGRFLAMRDKTGLFKVQESVDRKPIKEAKGAIGSGIGGAAVYRADKTYTIAGKDYENAVVLPKTIIVGDQRQIRNAQEEVADGLTDEKTKGYKAPEIEAIITDGKGKADKVVFKVRHEKLKKDAEGNQLYVDTDGVEGSKADLIKVFEEKNPTASPTRKSLYVKNLKELKSPSEFQKVIAPVRDNKWVLDKVSFIGYRGITEAPEEGAYNEATENSINSFMKANNITDRNKAIKILKDNNKI